MLALIAGMGALPKALSASQAGKPLVCSLEGFFPDGLDPHVVFRLEQLGTFLIDMKARGVSEVLILSKTTSRGARDLFILVTI